MSAPSQAELIRVFGRIGVLSFGGPAAQIALMHRELVEERRWLTEDGFLRALSLCMLLPGPEAMQLATYAGWRLRGTAGGLIAGLLFVAPGAFVILLLALGYALFGQVPFVQAAFAGIKAAVIIIVLQALRNVARKALTTPRAYGLAGTAFLSLFVLDLPFPLIIAAAALFGAAAATGAAGGGGGRPPPPPPPRATLRPNHRALGGALGRAGCRSVARRSPVSHTGRTLFLQAGGRHLRRRLRGAGLHDPDRGARPWLDHHNSDD